MLAPGEFAAVWARTRRVQGCAKLPASFGTEGARRVAIPAGPDFKPTFTIIILGANLGLLLGRWWLIFFPQKWERDESGGQRGPIPRCPAAVGWGAALHGPFRPLFAPHPIPREKRRRRKECLRTIGLTPKLEAAKRSEAETLVEAVVWA